MRASLRAGGWKQQRRVAAALRRDVWRLGQRGGLAGWCVGGVGSASSAAAAGIATSSRCGGLRLRGHRGDAGASGTGLRRSSAGYWAKWTTVVVGIAICSSEECGVVMRVLAAVEFRRQMLVEFRRQMLVESSGGASRGSWTGGDMGAQERRQQSWQRGRNGQQGQKLTRKMNSSPSFCPFFYFLSPDTFSHLSLSLPIPQMSPSLSLFAFPHVTSLCIFSSLHLFF